MITPDNKIFAVHVLFYTDVLVENTEYILGMVQPVSKWGLTVCPETGKCAKFAGK